MSSSKRKFPLPLTNVIAYLCLGGLALYTLEAFGASLQGAAILVCVASIAVLFTLSNPEKNKWQTNCLLLGIESLLGGVIIALSRADVPYPVIFFILSAQAVSVSPGKSGFLWIAGYAVVSAVGFITANSLYPALLNLAIFAGGYLFFGVFAQAFAQADAARRQTQVLLKQLEEAHRQLREQSVRDPLTGLFNRRYLEETLERETARSNRQEGVLSLVLLDIDRFKLLNDTYGHLAGDEVLKALADLLQNGCRMEDIACRYGGEEMIIVLPGMPLEKAVERAEEWRLAFERLRVAWGKEELKATISLGVAAYPQHTQTGKELINCADRALYRAKREGRNRVQVYRSVETALQG